MPCLNTQLVNWVKYISGIDFPVSCCLKGGEPAGLKWFGGGVEWLYPKGNNLVKRCHWEAGDSAEIMAMSARWCSTTVPSHKAHFETRTLSLSLSLCLSLFPFLSPISLPLSFPISLCLPVLSCHCSFLCCHSVSLFVWSILSLHGKHNLLWLEWWEWAEWCVCVCVCVMAQRLHQTGI